MSDRLIERVRRREREIAHKKGHSAEPMRYNNNDHSQTSMKNTKSTIDIENIKTATLCDTS